MTLSSMVVSRDWQEVSVLECILGGLHMDVTVENQPQRALTRLSKSKIDALIVDRDLNGSTQLLRELQEPAMQTRTVPLVIMGGSRNSAALEATGALFAFEKPISVEQAVRTLSAARNMIVTGIGLGLMMQVFVLSVQNSVPSRHIGSATALIQFSRSIGSTLGVTIMGVIVNQGLPGAVRGNQASLHRLAPHARAALANALHPAFLSAAIVSAIVFLLVVFGVKEVPLRSGFEEPTLTAELGEGGGGEPVPATRR